MKTTVDILSVQCVLCGALPGAPCTRRAWWWERLYNRFVRNVTIRRVPVRPHIARHASRALEEHRVSKIKVRA